MAAATANALARGKTSRCGGFGSVSKLNGLNGIRPLFGLAGRNGINMPCFEFDIDIAAFKMNE